ncbi:hypothetical protein Cgig2_001544 [Carnegiea gigantea]|uniref:Uncharacterized protein n=1 Tax=Carnegiea gigantea TaxID=171969 RepID=A0A9Q1GSM3_9CARY|nr:hypothetical protein Cgig2_001544 [Carnegiea gigantea]
MSGSAHLHIRTSHKNDTAGGALRCKFQPRGFWSLFITKYERRSAAGLLDPSWSFVARVFDSSPSGVAGLFDISAPVLCNFVLKLAEDCEFASLNGKALDCRRNSTFGRRGLGLSGGRGLSSGRAMVGVHRGCGGDGRLVHEGYVGRRTARDRVDLTASNFAVWDDDAVKAALDCASSWVKDLRYVKSLSGHWKFHLASGLSGVPQDFHRIDFHDSDWGTLPEFLHRLLHLGWQELAQEKAARQRDKEKVKSKISKLWRFFKSQKAASSTAPPEDDDEDEPDPSHLDDSSDD